ncbi:AraC family ligand binding domain-containing protein [Pedobacter steynii]
MKPQLLKVANNSVNSFSVRRDRVPYINNRWHYHAEVELIYFKKGNGTQFIGDSIKRFRSGDVVLVGAHLPHYWRFDDNYFNDEKNNADVVVVHFCENFWGTF